ncbi:MAG: hypothetical protein KGI52_17960 [Burkholderiales bacterium]|nr:hypothetical protein [Burkholderiales bacterium]
MPIFRSVSHALHVAYLIDSLPASQRGPLQIMIEAHMRALGIWDTQARSTSVQFGRLAPLEVRAQCSMIIGAVRSRLPGPERDAVQARYAHQVEKANGVAGVRNYAQPMLSLQDARATLAAAWSIYVDRKHRRDLSIRAIAEEYKLSPAAVGRDVKRIRHTGESLEKQAIDRLAELFVAHEIAEAA